MSLKKLCQWRIFIMEFICLPTFTRFTFIFFLSAYERLVFCMFTIWSTVLTFQNQQSVLSATTRSYYRVCLFMGVPCKLPRPLIFFWKGWTPWTDPDTRIKGHNCPLQFRTHQFKALSYLRGLSLHLGIYVCLPSLWLVAVQVSLNPCSWSSSQMHGVIIHDARESLSRSPAQWLRHTTRMHSTSFHTLLSWWAS